MERRLLRLVVNPAMIATCGFRGLLALTPGLFRLECQSVAVKW